MNESLKDAMSRAADAVGPAEPDLAAIERRGEQRRTRRYGATGLVAAVLAAVAVAVPLYGLSGMGASREPTSTTARPANGLIAYAPIGEQRAFWTIRPDGSDATKVRMDVPGFVSVPSWSPDGSRITFAVNSEDEPHPEGGNWDIYVANADGSNTTRLTSDRVDHSPVWSPDGTQIAFVYGYGEDQQIRVMNADGSDSRELTSDHGPHLFPSWAPDGSQIAFVAFDGTNANIYVMNADGSGARRLTNDPSHEDAPAWSPDGSLIAFTSEGGARAPGVYAMSPDGTGVTELTHDPDPANLSIAWSPDGAKMALVSLRGPGFDRNIYVLDLASRAVTIVGQPGAYSGVSWQPVSNEVTDTPSASPQPATISSVGGIQVEVPPGWSVAQENLTPWLSHPTEVLSVGTFEMPVSHDPDDEPRVFDAPVAPAALAAMTATDAFVSLQASGPTDAPDDRPPSFRTAENRPCCSEQTGDYPFTWWWIPFIDQGRAFYLFVAVGNHAESSISDQAWAIANSLVVDGNKLETPTASATP